MHHGKIIVSEKLDVELTVAEYRDRLGGTFDMPLHNLFDVVEYIGEYNQPQHAMVTGFSRRSGGWYYSGQKLTMNGSESVEFPERDILRGWKQ
ncbi:MAG: hypothetical protein ACO33E_06000 [Aquiluna sp.]